MPINATLKDQHSNAEVYLINQYGEVDTSAYTYEEFQFVCAVADRWGILLSDTREYVTDISAEYGFQHTQDGVIRMPVKDEERAAVRA